MSININISKITYARVIYTSYKCTPLTLFYNKNPMFLVLTILFLFTNLLLALENNSTNILDDAEALLAFKGNLTNPGDLSTSWQNTSEICTSWTGVTCTDITIAYININANLNLSLPSDIMYRRRVRSLRLPGREVHGPIAIGTLGKLDKLEILSLHHNRLIGSLPYDLANCKSLKEVHLSHNLLNGKPIPNYSPIVNHISIDYLSWPPLLQHLDLSSNNFSGEIPSSFDHLANLRYLMLQNNKLSGLIPSLMDISTKLRTFNVANNTLEGSIPPSLSRFPEVSFIGNGDLCGYPLQNECTTLAPSPTPTPTPLPSDTNNSLSNVNTWRSSNKLSDGAIVAIAIGSVTGGATLLFFICFLGMWTRKSKRSTTTTKAHKNHNLSDGGQYEKEGLYPAERDRALELKTTNTGATNTSIITDRGGDTGEVCVDTLVFLSKHSACHYDYGIDDLLRASAEVLGKGGLGTSYKAYMAHGLTLCVKRLKDVMCGSEHDEIVCKSIVDGVGRLEHPNLVPIRAYFFAEKEKLLVTDYMPKGSLSALLHGNKEGTLKWHARLAIACGTAKGLVFLHSKKVVHGAIKSSNVLLDKGGEARWSDYGLVRLATLTKPDPETVTSLKPNGYTPPEVGSNLPNINYKGDVYSFGVLLLELLTGKSPMGLGEEEGVVLPRWVESRTRREEVLDRRLVKHDHVHHAHMLHLLHNVALACVSPSPDQRPHMVEIEKHIDDLQHHASPR